MQALRIEMHKPKFAFLLFICVIMFNCGNAAAYTPPIGIPDPGLWGSTHPIDGIAPTRDTKCPEWPNGQSDNCYYIDNTNQRATDTDNTYGYPEKPRLTIPAGTYAAGSYFELAGGPYTEVKTLTMKGTAEEPIWFRGTSPKTMPDIRAKISFPNSTYTIIENLNFNNFTGEALSLAGHTVHNVCVRNSKFQDMIYPGRSASVISSTPNQNGSVHDIVIYNNLFEDIGDYTVDYDQDYHAMAPGLWGRTPPTTLYNFWSLNNTAIRLAGSLNQFNGDQRDATRAANEVPPRTVTNLQNFHHVYSGKNLMYQSRQAMGAPKFATDAVYSQNVAYGNFSVSSGAGTGQGFQEGSRYVWILFNKYYDLTYGIRSSNTNFPGVENADLRAYMIGNVIYNIHNNRNKNYNATDSYKPAQAIGFEKAHYKRYIIDNTFYNVGGGINVGNQLEGDITDASGNVFSGIYGIDDKGNPDYHFSMTGSGGTYGTFIDHSFFQPRADNGTVTFKWAGAEPSSSINTLVALQSSSIGQCQNCWTGDPMFVDAANNDLHPRKGSPLFGKGIRHAVYDEFEARYGISIAYDFDGNPRPKSGPWTLGAYETSTAYSSSSSPSIENIAITSRPSIQNITIK